MVLDLRDCLISSLTDFSVNHRSKTQTNQDSRFPELGTGGLLFTSSYDWSSVVWTDKIFFGLVFSDTPRKLPGWLNDGPFKEISVHKY